MKISFDMGIMLMLSGMANGADGNCCKQSTDCANKHCINGICATPVSGSPSCTKSSDCADPTTQVCDSSVCVTVPPYGSCKPGCAPGYYCSASNVCTALPSS